MIETSSSALPGALELFRPGAGAGLAFFAVALAFIGLEIIYGRLANHDHDAEAAEGHDLKETTASIGVAVGDMLIRILTGGIAALPFFLLYNRRLFDIPMTGLTAWIALFFGVEFFYYWFHRASHRIRWLWATHAVHHSATHFNLSAAVRLGWTGQLTGAFVFFLPLAWLGFHPFAITAMIALGLFYQFFLHTALPVYLGPIEWVLNTPMHHRVHHASNTDCLDKNYGSTLILFDRMFGTFAKAPADERLTYGVRGAMPSNNPFKIALGEWARLLADARRASSWKQRLAVLFGTP
jgi:sterol desaturase/sphingolipid hydroxylase (fatty acid hydroxylase superfamily)